MLDVAEVQELVLAAAAFAVVSGEARAGAKRLTWLATGSAAAWAWTTCQVVVSVADDQLPLSPMLVRLAGKLCTVEDGSNTPRPEWVWCGGGEGKPGGDSLEDGAPIRSFGSLSKRGFTVPARPHQYGCL